MQEKPGTGRALEALRRGLMLAVSIAALSGCVSAVSTDMQAENVAIEDETVAAAKGGEDGAESAPTEEAATVAERDGAMPAAESAEEAGTDMAGLVLQPTALNAGAASIYATTGQAAMVPADATGSAARDATLTSIYAGSADGGRLPVEDMPLADPSAQQPLPLAGEEQSAAESQTARMALVGENAAGGAAQQALTASLFAAEQPAEAGIDAGAQTPRRVLNRDTARMLHTASLATNDLTGAFSPALPDSDAHSEAEEGPDEEAPAFTEVASLAGLARLAPNGLWLQTEKVRTGCFKPELLDVLHKVEEHYGKPIIVTSGLRGVKRNRAKQSLHTRCEAADIQIAGVGKWELADYLRSLPGRGGVGTYCHTESVHIDIGPARDWNWRCRRRK